MSEYKIFTKDGLIEIIENLKTQYRWAVKTREREKKILSIKFLKKVNDIIANVEFDMKNSQKLAENKEDEPKYYEGHWIGMDAIRVDYLLSLKEELEEEVKK